jgi:hypothetical protein
MIISGALGAALHVLIDGMYHLDVQVFWPNKSIYLWRTGLRYGGQDWIETVCLYSLAAAAVLYIQAVISYRRNAKTAKTENSDSSEGNSK